MEMDGTSPACEAGGSEREAEGGAIVAAAKSQSDSSDNQSTGAQNQDEEKDEACPGAADPSSSCDNEETSKQDSNMEMKVPCEHARLDALLSQIPKKAQHGLLMQCDLILTCIDADENYVALGTNIGLTFLYNRKDQSMQRLKSETSSDVITCVKLHHGVDHQLATGMASGTVCIFLIPGYISLHKKQLQKFEVKAVHRHYVTCVEWSTNGMKLYSGDKTGHVVCTEVDFYQGQCRSLELLVEPPTEIVQLHYDHKVLLVSTKVRSFVCRLDTTCEISQIGQKDRKVQGNFGACFIPGLCKTDDAMLYAARPGCRVWLSDIRGTVCNTLIFKDQLANGVRDIPLLRPGRNTAPNLELQFGRMYMYREKQLVTFNQSTLFILDPELSKVVASQNRLSGVVDVAVTGDEIFVLRRHTDDFVIRIAENPETVYHTASVLDYPLPSASSDSTAAPQSATHLRLEVEQKDQSSSPTSFFKKKFFTPFKKLDSLIHEHAKHSKEPAPQSQPVDSSRPQLENLPVKATGENVAASGQSTGSPDLPPVVELNSPDLDVRVFTGGHSPTSPVDVASPDSAHSALSAFADELTDSRHSDASGGVKIQVTDADGRETAPKTGTEHWEPIDDRIHLSANKPGSSDDIVFAHHSGKKKAKKKKHKGKDSDKDGDNVSQSSFGSQVSEDIRQDAADGERQSDKTGAGEEGEGMDALRRAEEALTSVDKFLKEDGSSGQSTVPTLEEILGDMDKDRDAPTHPVNSGEKENIQTVPEAETESSHTLTDEGSESKSENKPVLSVDVEKSHKDIPVSENQPVKPDVKQADRTSHVNKADEEQTSKPPLQTEQTGKDPLAAAEDTLLNMRKDVSQRRQESAEDFYSLFSPAYSPTDAFEEPVFSTTEEKSVTQSATPAVGRQSSIGSGGSDGDGSVSEANWRLANSWSEFTTPANIYSLALSQTHIWFTDKSENLYYSALGGTKGIVWRKVGGEPANQISVSPSGHIVWRLYRGRVFAGTKITHRHPEGLKWVEAVRDVSHISVDDRCAWYVKTTGEVMMQRDLSRERPCFRSLTVQCPVRVKKVMARYGVVWAITESLKLLVRTGISVDVPQGLEWQEISRHMEPFLFSSCSIDSDGIGWAVDVVGQIWFTDKVSPTQPAGSGHWWQVPLSEYYVQDPTMLDLIRSIAKKFDPQKLTYVMSTSRGGLIVAGDQGVWLAMDYQNTLHVCRGSLLGLVWAQQVNGELYAIPPDSSDATLVASPLFVSVAVNEHSVWGLTENGEIHVRTGIGSHCPLGAAWAPLDLSQLGDVFLVHLSCNRSYVWAVDSDGQVFNRIGAKAPKPGQLNPVWLPIDTYSEIVFTKVVNGPMDWMVWAVDNRRLTYVRAGITEEMPIGREWVHVPGIQAMDVTLSSTGVWALNTNGEIFFRYGITQSNVSGNYWKKIPGAFIKISASSGDMLWAVNTSGQLVKCSTRFLFRRQESSDPLLQRAISSTGSEEGDWELV